MNYLKYDAAVFRAAQLTDENIANAAAYYEIGTLSSALFSSSLRTIRIMLNTGTAIPAQLSVELERFERCMNACAEDSVAAFLLSPTKNFCLDDPLGNVAALSGILTIGLDDAETIYGKVANGQCPLYGFALTDKQVDTLSSIGISAVPD